MLSRPDLLDVGQREVAGDQRPLHHHDRQHGAGDAQPGVTRRQAQEAAVTAADAVDRGHRPERRRRQRQHQPGPAEGAVQAGGEHVSDSAGGLVEALGVLGLVLVGVLDLDPVAVERVADQLAVDDDRLALLEDPARLPGVAHGHGGAVEGDRERREAVDRLHGAAVDGALDAQPAAGLAAVARADLVDVAVVVDRRAQELGDDHPAGDEHEGQHDDRRPPRTAARRRGLAGSCRGLRSTSAMGPSATAPRIGERPRRQAQRATRA